jgi:hypothetical protein
MVEDGDVRRDLLARIAAERASVQAHIREHGPKSRRRANITIVLTSLSAVFTVGPAVGGEGFAGTVSTRLGLGSDSIVWRVLCLAAVLVSVAAAVLTNLGKSHEAAVRLSTAEAVEGELEGLSLLLEFGHLPIDDAVKLYQQYTSKIGFIPDLAPEPRGHSSDVAPPRPEPEPESEPESADGSPRTRALPAVPPARRPGGRPPVPPR